MIGIIRHFVRAVPAITHCAGSRLPVCKAWHQDIGLRQSSVLTMPASIVKWVLLYLLEMHTFPYCYRWVLLMNENERLVVALTALAVTEIPGRHNLRSKGLVDSRLQGFTLLEQGWQGRVGS